MKLKLFLLLAGIVVMAAGFGFYAAMQVRATRAEAAQWLPGDNLIPQPIGVVNHAITIHASPEEVWPWLAQMGAGRGGWYSYDWIDNRGHRSAERILPEFQKIGVGTIFPAVSGAKDVFVVAECQPERSLVLAWRMPGWKYQTTWAFILEQPKPNETRLIVRGRVAEGYHPFGLPEWVAVILARPAHFVMQRKQLLTVAERAEASTQGARSAQASGDRSGR
jgi:hypothetical protein